MNKRKKIGYVVMEWCDCHEQLLALREMSDDPPNGVLCWRDGVFSEGFVFPSFKAAREAIARTEHYRLAFDLGDKLPSKCYCKIVPVEMEVDA